MFPGTKNRNEGTFGCSPVSKTGTRAHSLKPPFDETAQNCFPLEVGAGRKGWGGGGLGKRLERLGKRGPSTCAIL